MDVALEKVHTSGRRTRVGGWQRAWAKVAWGSGTEKGLPELFVRQREGRAGRKEKLCVPSFPLVADISEMEPGALPPSQVPGMVPASP